MIEVLPLKFLNIAIEALEYRIASMKAIIEDPNTLDEDCALIDYGNDIPILQIIITELQKAKKEPITFKKTKTLTEKIAKFKSIQEAWANDKQILFAKEVAFRITISVRDIWADESTTQTKKLESLKIFNELQHFVLNYINSLESEFSKNEQYHFFEEIVRQLSENETNKTHTKYLLIDTFLKINEIPDKTFNDFSHQYLIYHNALNEVCQGAYALPDWEFATLMGVTKPEALMLLNRQLDFFDNNKNRES